MPARAARNERKRNGHRRRKVCARVLAEESVCWICSQPVNPDLRHPDPWSGSVDEVIPVSRGGSPYDRDNVRLAHLRCNMARGNGTRHQRPSIAPYRSARRW